MKDNNTLVYSAILRSMRLARLCASTAACLLRLGLSVALGAIVLSGATTSFVDAVNSQTSLFTMKLCCDAAADEQTGDKGADFVGDATNGVFYTGQSYDGEYLYFRMRLGATLLDNQGQPKYSGAAWIGVQADSDAAIDMFIGINNQGNKRQIEFRAPGTGLNTSPSTTSISNQVSGTILETSLVNYYYASVSSVDPALQATDVGALNGVDAYLTIRVPMWGSGATLQGMLQVIDSTTFTHATQLGYVVMTSQQTNSINQDIIGAANNSTTPWVYTDPETYPTPEPSTIFLSGLGFLALFCKLRKK